MLRNNGIHNFRSPYLKGPQPSISLDFVNNQTLDSQITFTRSTTATYANSSGVLTSSAINSSRFDYNPVTLACKGFLVEESRTNILLNSLLDGTNLSTQIVTTTATPYTLSFYGTGTIVLSGTNISTQAGSGAYPSRKTFTFTPTAGALTLTVTGTVQYAQLEVGSNASSFIPTAGSQVTRAVDDATMTGTNFSSWYNATQGTFLIQSLTPLSTVNADSMVISDGTISNRMEVRGATNGAAYELIVTSSGATVADLYSGSSVGNIVKKIAFSYQTNNMAASYNGAAPQTDLVNTVPSVNQMKIGGFLGNINMLNGWVQQFTYYPTVLTTAQLQALSGP